MCITPQNNPTERANKVIGAAMRSYINDNHKSWDREIDKIAVAMRTATNVVTGFTPFYLNHGQEFLVAGSDYKLLELATQTSNDDANCNGIKSRESALMKMSTVTNDIIRRMTNSYKRNKKYYDQNKVKITFRVGDKVYSRKNFSAKLAPKYVPCVIIEKISDLVYVLKDERGHIGRYHVKDIKHI